jgi:hypothetical protein
LSDSQKPAAPSAPPVTAGSTEQSFPLIALLQLATFMAAIAACVDNQELLKHLDRAGEEPLSSAAIVLAAAAAASAIGFIIGLGQLRGIRSAMLGAAFGASVGVTILCVYLAPAPPVRTAGAVTVMLLSTIAIRIRAA